MKKNSNNTLSDLPFFFEYGLVSRSFSIEQVQEIAQVHRKTVLRWANGTQEPHPALWELIRLKATRRILPDTRPWLACYVGDSGKLVMADGREFFPQEIYAADIYRSLAYTSERDKRRAQEHMARVVTSCLPGSC